MTFVYGGATPLALVVGAVLVVMSWHGLRRLNPTESAEAPPDNWPTAIFVTAVVAVFLIGGLVWTPWVTILAAIVFPLWIRVS